MHVKEFAGREQEYAIRSVAVAEDPSTIYVLSDGEPDRLGDIIEPEGWVLGNFNPVALFNHNRDLIVGRWEDVKVKGKQLIGRLVLAEEGSSPVINMVRSLIRQGMLDFVSVGFKALEADPLDPKDPWGPLRFTKSELLEASLVAVPANPRARRVVKEFFPNDADAVRLFAKPGELRARMLPVRKPGEPAATPSISSKPKMKLSDGIKAKNDEIVVLRDKLTGLAGKIEANGLEISDEDAAEQETLTDTLKAAEQQLGRLQSLERSLAIRSNPDAGDDDEHRDVGTEVATLRGDDGNRDNPIRQLARNARGYDLLVRAAACAFIAHVTRKPPEAVLVERYSKHRSYREIEAVVKAATAPAMTNVVGWAAELVGANVQALLDTIKPVSIYPRLAARGTEFSFDGMQPITVPARQYGTNPSAGSPTDRNRRLAGAWVGQGAPIPVRQGLFTGITLNPYKLGVISTFTREMANASTPAMEQIIREAIAEDTAWVLDMSLLSDTAAIPNVRPAGIFVGVTPLTPTAAGPDAAITDLKALLTAVIGAGGGRSVVLIMNPLQSMNLALMHEGGLFYFRDEIANGTLLSVSLVTSITVPVGEVYCMDAADFASATGQPAYDVSDQATLHMDDGTYPDDFTAPTVAPISTTGTPNAVAAPVRSLWQTASIGVRMLLNASWAMRRPGMVAMVVGVNW
jgi:HK97 family phage prohead protease